jgi:hypothetical protein
MIENLLVAIYIYILLHVKQKRTNILSTFIEDLSLNPQNQFKDSFSMGSFSRHC